MENREETSSTPPSRRDSLANASTLLVELLQMIFSYYAEYKDLNVRSFFPSRPCWINVTYVCRHWRAAALSCSSLWTSIDNVLLTKRWIKAFIERSNPSLIDVRVRSRFDRLAGVNELVALLTGCTRLRSLHINAEHETIFEILDALPSATHLRSFSLSTLGQRNIELPDNLFGGQAPIRELRFFKRHSYFAAPHWLLRGITHFTSDQEMSFEELLDALGQMHVLHSFTLERCVLQMWTVTPEPPDDFQIRMPNLMYFTVDVDTGSTIFFAMLYRRMVLPDGAKKRIRSHQCANSAYWHSWECWNIPTVPSPIPEVIQAANGFQQVRLSGGLRMGGFRLWTGDGGYDEAEFSFEFSWKFEESDRKVPTFVLNLVPLCDKLGVERVRMLTIVIKRHDRLWSGGSFLWRNLLRKFPAVEELELCVNAVKKLRSEWKPSHAPAVFPKLRSLRVVRGADSTASVADGAEDLIAILQRKANQ